MKILRSFYFWAITGLTCFSVWTCYSQTSNLTFQQSQPKDDPLGIETKSATDEFGGVLVIERNLFVETKAKAEKGDAFSQSRLGYMLITGEGGVPKNMVEATQWFRKAAEQGDAYARCSLGNCYYNGDGVTKDYVEAVKWWRKAAEQNDASAQFNLGISYFNGDGVAKDYVEAYKWRLLAAARDFQDAKKSIPIMENMMTREQIAEGQKRARNFNDSLPTWENTKPMFDENGFEIVGGSNKSGEKKSMTVPVLVSVLLAAVTAFTLLVWWLMKRIDAQKLLRIALAAPMVHTWRFMKRIGAQKFILLCGTFAFVLCGLFPPWLYISSQGHTRSASSSFILSPPPTVGGAYGTKLDISRLAVEWLCIAVATGTVLLLVSKSEKKKELKG